jgi:hypothetical protein
MTNKPAMYPVKRDSFEWLVVNKTINIMRKAMNTSVQKATTTPDFPGTVTT